MKFCQDHWDRLRQAIEDRGLGDLISKDGELAVKRTARQVEEEDVTVATFDPLIGAFWAIAHNAMSVIESGGHSPLYLMSDGEEDPVELEGGEGKTWPRCPLCYLGLAHELTCAGDGCMLPKVDGFAYMIDKAADEQVEVWEELKAKDSNGNGST